MKQRYGKNSLVLRQQLRKREHSSNTLQGICLCVKNQRGYLKNGNSFFR